MEREASPKAVGHVAGTSRPSERCLVVGVLALLLTLTGCASHADRVAAARSHFFNGDLTAARSEIDLLLKKPKRDADALLLDRAMIELVS